MIVTCCRNTCIAGGIFCYIPLCYPVNELYRPVTVTADRYCYSLAVLLAFGRPGTDLMNKPVLALKIRYLHKPAVCWTGGTAHGLPSRRYWWSVLYHSCTANQLFPQGADIGFNRTTGNALPRARTAILAQPVPPGVASVVWRPVSLHFWFNFAFDNMADADFP